MGMKNSTPILGRTSSCVLPSLKNPKPSESVLLENNDLLERLTNENEKNHSLPDTRVEGLSISHLDIVSSTAGLAQKKADLLPPPSSEQYPKLFRRSGRVSLPRPFLGFGAARIFVGNRGSR